MPWSEWQTSPVAVQQWVPDATVISGYDRADGTGPGEIVNVAPGAVDILEAFWSATPTDPSHGSTFIAAQVTLTDDWLTARDWSPAALDALTLGTDYDVRPDREPGDVDAYVEYETGDSTPVSLFFAGLRVAAESTYAVTFHYGYLLDTAYVPGVDLPAIPALSALYSTAGTSGYVDLDSYFPTGSLFPNGSSKSVTIGGEISGPEPVPSSSSSLLIDRPNIALRYRMPRWRYWIPGGFVRLRQRDDGLNGTTRRLRTPTSRQSGPRLRGYL